VAKVAFSWNALKALFFFKYKKQFPADLPAHNGFHLDASCRVYCGSTCYVRRKRACRQENSSDRLFHADILTFPADVNFLQDPKILRKQLPLPGNP